MPNDAAHATTFVVFLLDALHGRTDQKELLVAGNFFAAHVKDYKTEN